MAKIECDYATKKFFKNKPKWYVTTLAECPVCGLYYKPSLGHAKEHCKPKVEVEAE